MPPTGETEDEEEMNPVNPRNQLAFSWQNNTLPVDAVFDMVSEAPAVFVAEDILSANLTSLLSSRDREVVHDMAEGFIASHNRLLRKLASLANSSLYKLDDAEKHRVTHKMLESFLRKCLRVLAPSTDYRRDNFSFFLSQIDQAAEVVADQIIYSPEQSSVPDLKMLKFPTLCDHLDVSRLISEEQLRMRNSPIDLRSARAAFVSNHQYFMFYYLIGLCSKFLAPETIQVFLKPRDEVLRHITSLKRAAHHEPTDDQADGECFSYRSAYHRIPNPRDMDCEKHAGGDVTDCLITACSTRSSEAIAELILGDGVLSLLDEPTRNSFTDKIHLFKKCHNEMLLSLDYGTLPWVLDPKAHFEQPKRSSVPDDQQPGNLLIRNFSYAPFVSRLASTLTSTLGDLFCEDNVEQISHRLTIMLRLWKNDSPLLPDDELCDHPVSVPFIEDLPCHLSPSSTHLLSSIQRAVYFNSSFFALFYTIHWLRRFVHLVPSTGKFLAIGARPEPEVCSIRGGLLSLIESRRASVCNAAISKDAAGDSGALETTDSCSNGEHLTSIGPSHLDVCLPDIKKEVGESSATEKEMEIAASTSEAVTENGGSSAEFNVYLIKKKEPEEDDDVIFEKNVQRKSVAGKRRRVNEYEQCEILFDSTKNRKGRRTIGKEIIID